MNLSLSAKKGIAVVSAIALGVGSFAVSASQMGGVKSGFALQSDANQCQTGGVTDPTQSTADRVELGNFAPGAWWTAEGFGPAVEVKDGMTVTITFHTVTDADATGNWQTPSYVVSSGSGFTIGGTGAECWVGRSDNWGWSFGTNFDKDDGECGDYKVLKSSAPADWAAWLSENKKGVNASIIASRKGDEVTVTSKNINAVWTVTGDVYDSPVYITLTGEKCTMTDIVAQYTQGQHDPSTVTPDEPTVKPTQKPDDSQTTQKPGDSQTTQKPPVTPTLKANTITAKNFSKTAKSKAQSFSIGAKVNGSAKLTYKSNNKKIKVDSKGKVTIAKNYSGKATITITSAKTAAYKATTKKITVTVKPAAVTKKSIKATSKKKTITVKYKKAVGAVSYKVEVSTSKKFTKKTTKSVTVKKTSATIKKLKAKTKYYVRVTAIGNNKVSAKAVVGSKQVKTKK